jgi:hypothetical protein
MRNVLLCGLTLMILSGCLRGVREEDLNAWVGKPVSLLDSHPLFMTVPLETRFTSDGVEVRNYRNSRSVSSCAGQSTLNSYSSSINSYANCYQNDVVCNNIFYIKNNKVLRYEPTGRCYTDTSVQPRQMY